MKIKSPAIKNLENIAKNHKTSVKAGIISLATLGTYLFFDSAEGVALGNVANTIDFLQTTSSMAVPYVMANVYMNKPGDSSAIKHATKILPMLFLPEALGDLGFVFGETYSQAISNSSVYFSALGASFPFFGAAKRALNKW